METEILKQVGAKFNYFQTLIILFVLIIPQILKIFFERDKKKEKEKNDYYFAEQHKQRIEKDNELFNIIKNFAEKNAEALAKMDIFIGKVEDYNNDRKNEFLLLMNNVNSKRV
jgi:hypothetical protein